MKRGTWLSLLLTVFMAGCAKTEEAPPPSTPSASSESAQTVAVSKVISQQVNKEERLPADLLAFRDVALYPKEAGFVQWIGVDRGSMVKAGQLLIKLSAPELGEERKRQAEKAQAARDDKAQAESDLKGIADDKEEADATLKSVGDTYKRMKDAASYPGIISGNDLEIAEKRAEAAQARVKSLDQKMESTRKKIQALTNQEKAAMNAAQSSKVIEAYLKITAPFDGVITERNVHEGSFVKAPGEAASTPLLRIQELSVLRLVVPVPELDVAAVVPGAEVQFTVPAFAGKTFTGTVRRIGHALTVGTRTMPVEMDVQNSAGQLSPGMFAEVLWPIRRSQPTLFVPTSAIARTTERNFVVRIKDGTAEWVDVKPGLVEGDTTEVFGNLQPDDMVATRGTDELRNGSHVTPKM